jgi:two-component system sensor histidine kinase KdpD
MNTYPKPDPDKLLEALKADELQTKGRLKIYLGMAAGVGKTFAMLSDAIIQKNRGIDIVVGYLEQHGRPETESLADELESIPVIKVHVSGAVFRELDLDGVLKRKPVLVLVDELAHTNVSTLRHKKRWQDVDEILRAGINVYTTVNIQHVESLKDVVAKITGVTVQETIPDEVISQANDIEVIDLPPRELIERLRDGKVYTKERVDAALNNFFREGNLIALRELVLRQTAERVDAQMRHYRLRNSVTDIWPTTNRVMVCVGPSPTAAQLVRAAKRLADSMHAGLLAVSLESSQYLMRSEQDRTLATSALELARSLGAEIVVQPSQDLVEDLARLASEKNITGIVLGKSIRPRWMELFSRSLVDDLLIRSAGIDIHVLSLSADPIKYSNQQHQTWQTSTSLSKLNLLASFGILAIVTLVCELFPLDANLSNMIMLYLLASAWIAFRYSPAEAVVSSIVAVLAFDFFFVPPRLTFSVSDTQFLPTFGVMFIISLLISSLTLRLKAQTAFILKREQRALLLAELSKELLTAKTIEEVGAVLNVSAERIISLQGYLLIKNDSDQLMTYPSNSKFTISEQAVAQWSLSQRLAAGKSTGTLPGSDGFYLPIISDEKAIALLGFYGDILTKPGDEQTIAAISNQILLALKRIVAEEQSTKVQLEAESERLRNTLLSSISHDLRTPLATIEGAASTLVERDNLSSSSRQELSRSILDQSRRLHHLIRNILNFTKIASGKLQLHTDWHSLEELIGSAISQSQLKDRKVTVSCHPGLELVAVDGTLIQQVFQNLIDNFTAHTNDTSELSILVSEQGDSILVQFSDNGPGIKPGEGEKIFEKLYRPSNTPEGGFGLGLAICKAIMHIHGGKIYAQNNEVGIDAGGASFFVVFPRSKQPSMDREFEE